jgi:uncharacterized protein (TIGR00251 family)
MLDELKKVLEKNNTVSFGVRVRPFAPETIVTGRLADGTYKINVDAPAEEGKANEELVRFLAKALGVAPPRVRILAGGTGRRKLIKIEAA